MSATTRARSLASRALGRAARPALSGPGSVSERVDAIERSLDELWRISEEMRAAIDGMRQSVEEQLPDIVEDVDKRIAHHDEARSAEIQGLEVMRRRLEELEAAVRDVTPR